MRMLMYVKIVHLHICVVYNVVKLQTFSQLFTFGVEKCVSYLQYLYRYWQNMFGRPHTFLIAWFVSDFTNKCHAEKTLCSQIHTFWNVQHIPGEFPGTRQFNSFVPVF